MHTYNNDLLVVAVDIKELLVSRGSGELGDSGNSLLKGRDLYIQKRSITTSQKGNKRRKKTFRETGVERVDTYRHGY